MTTCHKPETPPHPQQFKLLRSGIVYYKLRTGIVNFNLEYIFTKTITTVYNVVIFVVPFKKVQTLKKKVNWQVCVCVLKQYFSHQGSIKTSYVIQYQDLLS